MRCQYELWVEEYFGLPYDFPTRNLVPGADYHQLVNMLAMYDTKKNQSLRSELQKQREEIERQRYDLFHITADRDTLSAELANLRQMADKQPITKSSLIEEFNTTIEAIENRCMATDGPVTPTLQEASEDELSRLWQLIQGIKKEHQRLLMALVTRDGELTHKSMYAELEKQKELNAELVNAIELYVFQMDKFFGSPKVGQPPGMETFRSLIKKSKES